MELQHLFSLDFSNVFNSRNNGYGDSNEGLGDGDGSVRYIDSFYNQDCLPYGSNSNKLRRITRWQ
jgi:hypothetical protein